MPSPDARDSISRRFCQVCADCGPMPEPPLNLPEISFYATTNPEEDIAKSWAYFVLKAKPDGDTIAEAKILFFYEWPELTKLRAQIIPRTHSHLQ